MAKKIKLTNKDDDFKGSGKDEIISARGGDDNVSGGGGNDTINGGEGNDSLKGGSGDDTLNGGAGNDILLGGTGDDSLNGGAGTNTVDGGEGDDTIKLDGNFADAKVTKTVDGTGYIVTTAGGTTTVKNVELFQFADGTKTESELITVDPSTGKTFVLTGAIDNLVGTTGNDTFLGDDSGTPSAISPADTLAGGDGTDTAELILTKNATSSLRSSGVETFSFQSTNDAAVFDFVNITDVTTIQSKSSTNDLKVQNVAALATIAVSGGVSNAAGSPTKDLTVQFLSGVAGADKTLNVSLNTGFVDDLKVGSADGAQDFGTISIDTKGGNSVIGDIDDGNGNDSATTKIVFTGDKRVTIEDMLENVTTFDASKSTGGARVVIDTGKDVAFTGGTGGDRVDIGGAGLTSADKLDGGDGSDTLRTGQAITAIAGANVKGFEVLEVRGNITQDVDAIIAANKLTSVLVTADVTATVNNINAEALGGIVLGADTITSLTLTGKSFVAGGTSDTATITLDNSVAEATNGVDVTALTFANADVLNIVSKSDGTPVAGEQNSIGSLTATDVEKIVITGDQPVSIVTAGGTAPTEVDASALTAALTLNLSTDVSGTGALVKGTVKDDVITGTGDGNTTGDTIFAGAGNDAVTVDAGGTVHVRDTIGYLATALNTMDVLAANADTITGFEADNVAGSLAQADVIDFTSTLEGLIKVGGAAVGSAIADVTVGGALSATTNIAAVTSGSDLQIQFDLNGDGIFTASNDFSITVTGQAGATLKYDAAGDFFYLTNGKITGTAGDDTINGGALADNISGLGGNDTINGNGGDDTIDAGAGADIVTGGTGNDTINLGADADGDRVIFTGAGDAKDTISNFFTGDLFDIDGGLQTALDDIAADGNFAYTSAAGGAGTTTAANVSATAEALAILGAENGGAAQVGAADLSNLARVSALIGQECAITAAAGADALIVIQSSDSPTTYGVYLYTENGTTANNVGADELTLLATVTGANNLTTANFDMFA